MIERYNLPEIAGIWSEENKFRTMMEVEILACEALAEMGEIPKSSAENIRAKANFDVERIKEIEAVTRHDVIAFVSCIGEYVGEDAKYIHLGMTSSDVLDTALSVQMKQAGELILAKMEELAQVIKEKALEHKDTLCIGRTHGIHAEPVTFGLKMAMWYTEMQRNIQRLKNAVETISVGQISGAVGTFANIDPRVEEYVCAHLGLKPALVSTQVIQRDRHAEYLMTLALIGTSLDKFATELRHLQKTETFETMEDFAKGQKGSSAMPHKRNPITSERICGMARMLRGNVIPAMENAVLWHERDIAHSSVERMILPDSTSILYYMLTKMIWLIKNLHVNKEQMLENVNKTLGLVFSQRLLLSLVNKGMMRDDAYPIVQENALRAWDTKTNFIDLVKADERITTQLTNSEIDEIFDYGYHTKNIDYIFKRAGLL